MTQRGADFAHNFKEYKSRSPIHKRHDRPKLPPVEAWRAAIPSKKCKACAATFLTERHWCLRKAGFRLEKGGGRGWGYLCLPGPRLGAPWVISGLQGPESASAPILASSGRVAALRGLRRATPIPRPFLWPVFRHFLKWHSA